MDLLRGLNTGELQIGVGPYPAAMMVGRTVARLVREHPAVRLRISKHIWLNLLGALRRREVDLAVMDVASDEQPIAKNGNDPSPRPAFGSGGGCGDEGVKTKGQQEARTFKASRLRGINNIQNGREALPSPRTSAELRVQSLPRWSGESEGQRRSGRAYRF